jgi:hypothetical protein
MAGGQGEKIGRGIETERLVILTNLDEMEVKLQRLSVGAEVEGHVAEVERSVTSMNRGVVIWTEQRHVGQRILTATTQPM